MGEEFVAVIKLVSGEEILASVCVDETGEEPIIIAHTPVTMKMINNGMYVKIKPWMDLADDDMFVFRTDKIITMTEIKDDKIIKIYQRYVEEENEDNQINQLLPSGGEVKPDQRMGYISTVEDARKILKKSGRSPLKIIKKASFILEPLQGYCTHKHGTCQVLKICYNKC